MSGLHFHPLQVSAVVPDGDDAMLVSFDVPPDLREAFAFAPGQYLTLRHVDDSSDLRRSYSICAASGEALRVGVRHVDGGAFSSWLHEHLRAGHIIESMPPQGRFGAALQRQATADEARARHWLGIAGGSGITPILSILKTALEGDSTTRFTLIYGNRVAASTMFKEELEDLKNRYLTRLALHNVLSREQVDSPLGSGRIDGAKLATFLRLCGRVDEAFICGPHALNDETEAALLAAGIAPERIHIERFGVPPAQAQAVSHAPQIGDATTAIISVLRDGLTREVAFTAQDESILAAASRAGMDVPYSCKSGVCATCRAKLIEGRVRMDRNFALEKSELDAGFILTCQSHPLTERVVVSFDER